MAHFIKKISLFLFCFGLLASLSAQEQAATIAPMELSVTDLETSILIFPSAIKSVDRGSKEILSKVVKDITNVLKLKASSENMAPTNLHVFTADGKVYAFSIKYNQNPSNLTIDFTNSHTKRASPKVKFAGGRLNDAEIERCSNAILKLEPHYSRPHSIRIGKALLGLTGAYLKDGVLFFRLSLKNNAKMPYQPDFIRCYVRDKRKTKRASVTEQEIQPLFTNIRSEMVASPGKPVAFAIAFSQFTIADGKFLAVEVFEKNGDRVLTVRLKGKHLLKVRRLEI